MEELTPQLVKALRGSRSQSALSRKLGYRSNVVAKWESGLRHPTLGELFRGITRLGIDLGVALSRFHRPASAAFDPSRPEAVEGWLRALVGPMSRAELAERTGLSRHQIGRLLRGDARGRLPESLTLIEGATGRASELVALLVDVERIPSLRFDGDHDGLGCESD